MVDKQTLEAIAAALEADAGTPAWILQTIQWWRQGSVSDEEFFNSISFLANEAIITGGGVEGATFEELFPQQTIQLIALGESTVERAEENIRQDAEIAAINQAIETNREWLSEVNLRLSGQLVEAGQSITAVAQQQEVGDIFGKLGLGLGGGAIIAIAVLAFVFLRRK